jgi:hypothetical protein
MTDTVRVYVNATAVDVARGATAIDCVRAWRSDEADAVAAGRRVITDSRGLPIEASATAQAGSIYRTIANRQRDTGA